MTDLTFDPAALRALLARAHDEIANIAEGKRRWTMSIPAKLETDSDLLISSALSGAEKALDALAGAREELAEAQRERDQLGRQQQALLDLCSRREKLGHRSVSMADVYFTVITDPADAVPAAAPQADDGPGHCGLCGSEDCPGKPGEGCTPGPFEAYEPEIPNNPYPKGDPRGWVKYRDCITDMCAAQRQHTPNCPQAAVLGDGEQPTGTARIAAAAARAARDNATFHWANGKERS